jgi:hypothetical protein
VRYFCLVCDYDGTIARDGKVLPSTVDALKRVRESGRKLILATGRELGDLLAIFPELNLFDRVVAENGGLLYRTAEREKSLLTKSPSAEFITKLQEYGVNPLSVGETIVSTWHPNETAALQAISRLGLDLQITFNKDAVMILPSGINKGTGVRAALAELGLSRHNVVGVGDAENDHGFLEICECAVAVENALPSLKERADMVTERPRGEGVEEVIEKLLANDLVELEGHLARHQLLLGKDTGDEPYTIKPYGTRLTVAGPSGSGKSTFISLLIEQLVNKEYQVCVIDPEGDYEELEGFVTLGRSGHKPGVSEVLDVLDIDPRSVTVNLLGVALPDRPTFFQKLLASIQELRSRTGRPHWVIIDEAHQMLPASLESASLVIPLELSSTVLVTVHPDHVAQPILKAVNGLVLVGADPREAVKEFNAGAAISLDVSLPELASLEHGEVVVWRFKENQPPIRVKLERTKIERRRHRQKYAAGELGEDKSFYFRGEAQKLNLRAQNMNIFVQMAEGIDDETWDFHLRSHDYSRWLRESVKDQAVADKVNAIEDDETLPSKESRERVLNVLREHYTAPA